MNFIDGELVSEAGQIQFARGDLRYALPPRLASRLNGQPRDQVVLGARPESINITHDAQGGIPGTVFVEEPLGSDTFFTIDVADSKVIVRTEAEFRAGFGEPVHIHFNPDKVYLFDRKTGNAISGREAHT